MTLFHLLAISFPAEWMSLGERGEFCFVLGKNIWRDHFLVWPDQWPVLGNQFSPRSPAHLQLPETCLAFPCAPPTHWNAPTRSGVIYMCTCWHSYNFYCWCARWIEARDNCFRFSRSWLLFLLLLLLVTATPPERATPTAGPWKCTEGLLPLTH